MNRLFLSSTTLEGGVLLVFCLIAHGCFKKYDLFVVTVGGINLCGVWVYCLNLCFVKPLILLFLWDFLVAFTFKLCMLYSGK